MCVITKKVGFPDSCTICNDEWCEERRAYLFGKVGKSSGTMSNRLTAFEPTREALDRMIEEVRGWVTNPPPPPRVMPEWLSPNPCPDHGPLYGCFCERRRLGR